mmetsp:Transcript_20200/g.29842  ORF Transcript_20200/g.29842 Transcript_20200/m.29842 type:complete len:213 (-) Transcript_20200:7-645(-)
MLKDFFGVDEIVSRHRPMIKIGDKVPKKDFETSFVAPNACVIGEVELYDNNTIGYGAVLRGDLSSIFIGGLSSVGDKTVINTVSTLSTGFPAKVIIGHFTTIEAGCTLTSCIVGNLCKVGLGSVIEQGAIMEKESVLLPGSVLSSGSYVKSGEIWGGNPAAFVEKVNYIEKQKFKPEAKKIFASSKIHLNEFNPDNMAFKHSEELAEKGIIV